MTKSWKQIVAEAESLGPLPDTSFEEYERRAAQRRQLVRTRVPAHATVEKVTWTNDGKVEVRAVVDLVDRRDAAHYAACPALDELIVNNVRLRSPALRVPGDPDERGPRRMLVVLTGETEAAHLPMLGTFPISLRVRGADDLQIDGFEMGALK